jgi:acyl-homoserine-lactone acylase
MADDLEAAGFALAWVQMEDYGLRVAEGLVGARGELARTRAEPGDIESDFAQKPWHDRAVASVGQLDADTRATYRGFAAGVAEYVRLHRDEFPDWLPSDYAPEDALARDMVRVGTAGAQRLAERLVSERIGKGGVSPSNGVGEGESVEYADSVRSGLFDVGSNAWAFAPSRTTSGNAILLRNPHLSWTAGYYEAHVTVPGVLNFYGDFRIGGPFGIIGGFNDYLGWATTNNSPDLDELYVLDVDPDRPDHYLFDGGSVPLERREVTVWFRNGPGLGRVTREIWETSLGPVVHRGGGGIWVLRSGGAGDYRLGQQFLAMMRSRNLDEWKAAMRMRARTSSNLTYADREGNIFYVWNATIPDLPHASGGDSTAVHASGTADVWTRCIPFDSLPQLLNPPGGYLHNENDPFHYANLERVFRADDYPSYFPEPELGLRSQHSLALIANDAKLSLEDVVRLKHSYRMLLAERVKDDLVRIVRETGATGEVAGAANLIEAWDATVAPDSRGGVLFEEWWTRYRRAVVNPPRPPSAPDDAPEPEPLDPFARPWTPDDPTGTPRGIAYPQDAAVAFGEAVRATADRYGSWDLAWGEVHRVRRGSVDVPVGGCSGALGCFRVLGYQRDETDGRLLASTGDGWVLAVEFGQTPRAFSVLAYGQSPDDSSPYHDDQAEMFARGELKRVLFTEADITAGTIRRYRPGEAS